MEPVRAKAGEGPAGAPSSPSPETKRKHTGGRARGIASLSPDLERIVKRIGERKAAPDRTANETYYERSLKIRRKLMVYLDRNEGAQYESYLVLVGLAANYARCGMEAAKRWIFQFTLPGMPFRILEDEDHVILERRDG